MHEPSFHYSHWRAVHQHPLVAPAHGPTGTWLPKNPRKDLVGDPCSCPSLRCLLLVFSAGGPRSASFILADDLISDLIVRQPFLWTLLWALCPTFCPHSPSAVFAGASSVPEPPGGLGGGHPANLAVAASFRTTLPRSRLFLSCIPLVPW